MTAGRSDAGRDQRHLLGAVACAMVLHMATAVAVQGAPGAGDRAAATARAPVMVARLVERAMQPTAFAPVAPAPQVSALAAPAPPQAALMPSTALVAMAMAMASAPPAPVPATGIAFDRGPRPLADIEPMVPAGAGASGGSVTLQLVISARGDVEKVTVVSASAPGVFDESALAAFASARFAPALRGGVPVRGEVSYQVDFAPLSTGADASSKTY